MNVSVSNLYLNSFIIVFLLYLLWCVFGWGCVFVFGEVGLGEYFEFVFFDDLEYVCGDVVWLFVVLFLLVDC